MFVLVGLCLNASVDVCSCRFVFECFFDGRVHVGLCLNASVDVCSCRFVFESFCWCLFL